MSRRLAGDAHLPVGSDDPARLGIGHVVLADMHAVAVEFHRQVWPVVHDQRRVALLADRPQRVGDAGDLVVGNVLQPELESRNVAAVEGGTQFVGEDRRMLDAGGRDEIETGGHGLPDFRVVYAEPGAASRGGRGNPSVVLPRRHGLTDGSLLARNHEQSQQDPSFGAGVDRRQRPGRDRHCRLPDHSQHSPDIRRRPSPGVRPRDRREGQSQLPRTAHLPGRSRPPNLRLRHLHRRSRRAGRRTGAAQPRPGRCPRGRRLILMGLCARQSGNLCPASRA